MQNFDFNVTAQEANVILQGLSELPGKICIPLINKLQAQAEAQNRAAQYTTRAAAEQQPGEL